MCGIAGWIGTITEPREALAAKMQAAIRHRGPDEQRAEHFDAASLVHARLKIIDLSENGAQPMPNERRNVWVAFNGEIYNHKALQQRLEQNGHQFRGTSDTEVIVHLYEDLGLDAFAELRGMFAIAIFDAVNNRLVLCRDRFGIKPIFYALQNDVVLFASELNALKTYRGLSLSISEQSLYDLTSFFYVPAPNTIYKDVYALLPGQVLRVDLDGEEVRCRFSRFHQWDPALSEPTECDALSRVQSLTECAVKSQLESDVPLGSLLSGGIDSSLVSYFAQQHSNGSLRTFNVKLPDAAEDETWAAIRVAEHIESRHTTLPMSSAGGDIEAVYDLIKYVGQPYCGTSLFGANAVCREMRKHVTVALSGDGGDEGFGGYTLYSEMLRARPFVGLPSPVQSSILSTMSVLGRMSSRCQRYRRLLSYFHGNDTVDFVKNFFMWLKEPELRQLWRGRKEMEPIRRYFEDDWNKVAKLPIAMREKLTLFATLANTNIMLLNDYLFKVDCASMKESLEVRVPMLDEELFQFGISLPSRLKFSRTETKIILRQLAAKLLPAEVAKKPRWGFGIPIDSWLNSDAKREIEATLLSAGNKSPLAEYYDYDIYSKWVTAFCHDQKIEGFSHQGLLQRILMLLSVNHYLA